jgi:Initiator Replication protein
MSRSMTLSQKTNHDGFPKAGELIEITGASGLKASDRAILNILYQHAHDSGRMGDPDAEWSVPLADLRFAASHNGNERVRDSLKRILRVVVTVPIPEPDSGEPSYLLTNLFDGIRVPRTETGSRGVVRFRLPRDLQPLLARSNRWGRIRAELVCAMTSKYAIALYELVQLRTNMDRCVETFPIARFRELMGVPPGKLRRGPDFWRFVVLPAIVEVGGLSKMCVSIALNRRSPRAPIETVTVAWGTKRGDEFRETLRERSLPKQGRAARLRGTVETAQPRLP